jgi:hypothetical protein
MTDVDTRSTARRDAALSPFLPSDNPGRAKVEAAVELLQLEISRLRVLQRAADRREAAKRSARVDMERRTQELSRQAEARVAARQQMLSVDRKWFWDFAGAVLDGWREERADAARRGQQGRIGQIDGLIDALERDLSKIQERDLALLGRTNHA